VRTGFWNIVIPKDSDRCIIDLLIPPQTGSCVYYQHRFHTRKYSGHWPGDVGATTDILSRISVSRNYSCNSSIYSL